MLFAFYLWAIVCAVCTASAVVLVFTSPAVDRLILTLSQAGV